MYTFEYFLRTTAAADVLWPLYAEIDNWLRWDGGLTAVTIDGPFVAGTTGTVTPEGMEPFPFTLTSVEAGRSFADVTPIPDGELTFEHWLEPVEGGTVVRHRVTLTGPAADEMGPMVTADTPHAVDALCALAETLVAAS
jgi:hypothetical protein